MKIKNALMAGALLLLAHAASANPINYSCTDCPITIGPDPETVTSTISVGDTGAIADLSVFIDAFHTFEGDLTITLEHNGTTALLFDGVGAADYFGGTYDVTADFAGAELAGDWNLIIVDAFFGDSGSLADWTLTGNTAMVSVSEPGMLLLLGVGIAGIGFARRRRS